MKKILTLLTLISINTLANDCEDCANKQYLKDTSADACSRSTVYTQVALAENHKKTFKESLAKRVYPRNAQEKELFDRDVNSFIDTQRDFRNSINACFKKLDIKRDYSCRMYTSMIKEKHPGGVNSIYTSAVDFNENCQYSDYLKHVTVKNAQGMTILKSQRGIHELKTFGKCLSTYKSDAPSFRKIIVAEKGSRDANFFVMDQFQDYPKKVKVLAKRYENKGELKFDYSGSRIMIFFEGGQGEDAPYLEVNTNSGMVTDSNFLAEDVYTQGECETKYNEARGTIVPRVSVDEKKYGFKVRYVSQ